MTNPDRLLEDVPVGEVSTGGPIVVTEEEIIAFGLAYDPQPFHTDPIAGAISQFGSLIASGCNEADRRGQALRLHADRGHGR
jgi:acyl dehydratase